MNDWASIKCIAEVTNADGHLPIKPLLSVISHLMAPVNLREAIFIHYNYLRPILWGNFKALFEHFFKMLPL